MEQRIFREFTKRLLNDKSSTRNFWIYYRYDDMENCEYFTVDLENQINVDPNKRIEKISNTALRFKIRDFQRWFRLMNQFISKRDDLKILIVDVNEFTREKNVVCVGRAGRWQARSYYEGALERALVGGLPKNMSLKYAS